MQKSSIVLAVMVLIGSATAQKPFKPYTSPDAKFTISFPGTPSVSTPTLQQTDDGSEYRAQNYSVADDAAYILLTADYPFATDNAALRSIATEQAASCGAAAASLRSTKNVQGRSALLFNVDCPPTEKHPAISLVVQAVLDGTRVYRVMYGTSDKPDDSRIFSFLTSFHINK
jgi:hypothetical protein